MKMLLFLLMCVWWFIRILFCLPVYISTVVIGSFLHLDATGTVIGPYKRSKADWVFFAFLILVTVTLSLLLGLSPR